MTTVVQKTCATIEATLSSSPAYRKIADDLYIVKQGSAYVMINVVPWGDDRVIVRCVAQMVTGVDMDGDLAVKLLAMNSVLRFGTFAYVPESHILLFQHSILGGSTLDPEELVATVTDVALIADDWDDKVIAEYGGRTMEDVITDDAISRIALAVGGPEAPGAESTWDDLTTAEHEALKGVDLDEP